MVQHAHDQIELQSDPCFPFQTLQVAMFKAGNGQVAIVALSLLHWMGPIRTRPKPVRVSPEFVTNVAKKQTGFNLSLAHQINPAIGLHQSIVCGV
jgi:hypothetical protein